MESTRKKRFAAFAAAVMLIFMTAFTVQDVYAKGNTTTKATTKAAEKPKTVAINIIVMTEQDAEVDITVSKIQKKKTASMMRTVSLKKGANYFTYNKGKKGKYEVSIGAFGDVSAQTVTAIQGAYTVFFQIAPPKDGDSTKTTAIKYQDLTQIKQKK